MDSNNSNQVKCPMPHESNSICRWSKRAGHVRDFPSVGLIECSTCLLVVHERDLKERISYETGTMHLWASGYGNNLESPYDDIPRRIEAISSLAKQFKIQKVLDFGSGKGEMLKALQSDFDVKGLEPEVHARQICVEAGFSVETSADVYIKLSETFDLVTLFHVVEHFYEPQNELSKIYKLLAPGGLLVLETPNSQDALLTIYNSDPFSKFTYWSHHPMLHSQASLTNLLSSSGLNVIKNVGIQRYGLANHLYWLARNLPGGHMHWNKLISNETEKAYEQDLARNMANDTIWVVAQKPEK